MNTSWLNQKQRSTCVSTFMRNLESHTSFASVYDSPWRGNSSYRLMGNALERLCWGKEEKSILPSQVAPPPPNHHQHHLLRHTLLLDSMRSGYHRLSYPTQASSATTDKALLDIDRGYCRALEAPCTQTNPGIDSTSGYRQLHIPCSSQFVGTAMWEEQVTYSFE